MPRKGTYKSRGERYYKAGQRDALNELEPVLRSVIEAIGLFASARAVEESRNKGLVERLNAISVDYGMPSRTTIDSAAVRQAVEAIEQLEQHNAGLRAVNVRLTDLVEVLRGLAQSRVDREALATAIVQQAAKYMPPPVFFVPEGALDGVDLSKHLGPGTILEASPPVELCYQPDTQCPRCGETAPEPASLCLTRHLHPIGTSCEYSVEGQARTAAELEKQEGSHV